jgi:hypothetical protein
MPSITTMEESKGPDDYLLSPYSPHTWTAAVERLDNRQTAFPQQQLATAKKKVRPGTVFLCYVLGKKEIVAGLEATSAAYLGGGDGILPLLPFPVRVDTRPLVRVPLGMGVALSQIREHAQEPNNWTGIHRGGLRAIPPADAQWILSALRASAEAY